MRQRTQQAPQTASRTAPKSEPPKLRVRKETVFAVHPHFSPESNAGRFLDTLIRLCADPPEYLHPQDAVRYLYLLPPLRAFTALPRFPAENADKPGFERRRPRNGRQKENTFDSVPER